MPGKALGTPKPAGIPPRYVCVVCGRYGWPGNVLNLRDNGYMHDRCAQQERGK